MISDYSSRNGEIDIIKDSKSFVIKVAKDTGKGIKGYIKAQLMLIGITFPIILVGLHIIKVPNPFLITLGVSILDLIPVVGIGIAMVPWAIVSFIVGNTQIGTGVAIILVITVILRQIIEPIIIGNQIGIRPITTFFATLLGSIILGPIGIILGPIFAILFSSILKNKKPR